MTLTDTQPGMDPADFTTMVVHKTVLRRTYSEAEIAALLVADLKRRAGLRESVTVDEVSLDHRETVRPRGMGPLEYTADVTVTVDHNPPGA